MGYSMTCLNMRAILLSSPQTSLSPSLKKEFLAKLASLRGLLAKTAFQTAQMQKWLPGLASRRHVAIPHGHRADFLCPHGHRVEWPCGFPLSSRPPCWVASSARPPAGLSSSTRPPWGLASSARLPAGRAAHPAECMHAPTHCYLHRRHHPIPVCSMCMHACEPRTGGNRFLQQRL